MKQDQLKIELWEIDKLHKWDKNPRRISESGMQRLIKQIQKLGVYKPLLITPDGTVIGGNMRLDALKEIGVTSVHVSIVEPKDENEKLEYALSDNDRAGFYDDDELNNLASEYQNFNWSDYAVDLTEPKTLDEVILSMSFEPVEFDEQRLDEKKKTTCPKCGHEFET